MSEVLQSQGVSEGCTVAARNKVACKLGNALVG